MIDLEKKFDKYEKDIVNYCLDRVKGYEQHDCYDVLKKRINTMNDSCALRINSSETKRVRDFKMNVVFPMVLQRVRLRQAGLNAYTSQPPLITLDPINDTALENARDMQQVLTANIKATKWQSHTLRKQNHSIAKYGCAVSYVMFERAQKSKIVMSDFGTETVYYPIKRVNTYHIPIQDYIQDPTAIDYTDSHYHGHRRKWYLSELIEKIKMNPEGYIKKNLKKAIEKFKKEIENSGQSTGNDTRDARKWDREVIHLEIKINIEGNEEDNTVYIVEMFDDIIIKFQKNQNTDNISGYDVSGIDKSDKFWWYNTDAEYVLGHENILNVMAGIMADNAMQVGSVLRFVPHWIDTAEINNRHKNGGFIRYDASKVQGRTIDSFIRDIQSQDTGITSQTNFLREIKENAGEMRTKTDFSRQPSKGGLSNKTATAATYAQGESDLLESDIFSTRDMGLVSNAEKQVQLLQQFLGEEIEVRANRANGVRKIFKENILGEFDYMVKSALTSTSQSEVTELLNNTTQILNLKNAAQQQLAYVNIAPIVEEAIRKMDMSVDTEKVIPDQSMPDNQMAMMQPGQQAMNPQTGMVPNDIRMAV